MMLPQNNTTFLTKEFFPSYKEEQEMEKSHSQQVGSRSAVTPVSQHTHPSMRKHPHNNQSPRTGRSKRHINRSALVQLLVSTGMTSSESYTKT